MEQEIWKPAPGFEGYYEVSNMGRVKAVGRNKDGAIVPMKKEKMMALVNAGQYKRVAIRKGVSNGEQKLIAVHRLVALAFVPNDDPVHKVTVNHKNEDKWDNRAENLEWLSHQDNTNYGTRNEKASKALKGRVRSEEHCRHISEAKKGKRVSQIALDAATKKNSISVEQYTLDGKFIATYSSANEAARHIDGTGPLILLVCKGRASHHKGFVWKYADSDAKEYGNERF